MRALAQPAVLKAAILAAAAGALLCYPRLSFWTNRVYPLWYLEALLFLGGTVLWAFVFAWHTKYTRRPVLVWKLEPKLMAFATLAGLLQAVFLTFLIDPAYRTISPEDYPTDVAHWLAMVLFSLAFTQLFLVFAPFAWLVRLFQGRSIAVPLTILFGVAVMIVRNRSEPAPLSPLLYAAYLAGHLIAGCLSVYFFLRGGVLLVWWWSLLVQSRHFWKLLAAM